MRQVYHSLAETKRRSALFERNLARILKHNAGGHSWKAGVNRFTDHTEEEFQRLNGVSPHLHREVAAVDASSYVAPVRAPKASSVDWRGKGILTAVKDQGQCGSCWTFGTTETVEAYWAMKTGLLNTLSEQFILVREWVFFFLSDPAKHRAVVPGGEAIGSTRQSGPPC